MKNKVTLRLGVTTLDRWTCGRAVCRGVEYRFDVRHYGEPPKYGLDGGRIEKLNVYRPGETAPCLEYDRGWWDSELTPCRNGAAVRAVYAALVAMFN